MKAEMIWINFIIELEYETVISLVWMAAKTAEMEL